MAVKTQAKAESTDTITVFVKANRSRKKHGGIWRVGFFFTLKWHEVQLTEVQIKRVEEDPNLELTHDEPEHVADTTMESATGFAIQRTMAESLLKGDPEDEENEDFDDEDDDAETGNEAIDKLLANSDQKVKKARPSKKVEDPSTDRKIAHKSEATKESEKISASKPTGQDEDEEKQDASARHLADNPLDPAVSDKDEKDESDDFELFDKPESERPPVDDDPTL